MLNALPPLRRRRALAALAALCAVPKAKAGPVAAFPDGATLVVAGPAGSRTDRWADLLSPPLARALTPGAPLLRTNVGGVDGVTGANQFEALAAPDGATALLVPGAAALSWLSGESRVRFDAARWVPVWAGNTSAAIASRVRLTPERPLRLAVSSVVGPELAALLALHLLGIKVVPVPAADGPAILARPDIDAVFLHGAALQRQVGALTAGGMPPVLTLGALDPAGKSVRDPAFPDLPAAPEAIARYRPEAPPELFGALRAVTAAVQLDVGLVLPQLSPAAIVALWRLASSALSQSPEVQAEAARTGTRPADAQTVAASTAAIAADVPTLLALRQWLGAQYNWRPT